MCIIGFSALMIVEMVMWSTISIRLEMSEALQLSANNVFKNYIDYFLAFLALAITLFEFTVGYQQSSCKASKGESSIVNSGKFIIIFTGLILFLYVPSIALIFVYATLLITIQIIRFVTLPGIFIYDQIFNKSNNPI